MIVAKLVFTLCIANLGCTPATSAEVRCIERLPTANYEVIDADPAASDQRYMRAHRRGEIIPAVCRK